MRRLSQGERCAHSSPTANRANKIATDVEGIFRVSGSAKRIKDLQEIFDSPERYGKGLDWTGYTVHDAANVFRRYLNQLPEPIVPLEFYDRFREPLKTYQRESQSNAQAPESGQLDYPQAVAAYQQLIRELPPLNRQLLLYILDLLAVFASKSDLNRMPSPNLSAIFQPCSISHPQHDMAPEEYKLSQDVLVFLIENQDHFLFGMTGTAADEQTLKDVEAGPAPRIPYSNSNSNSKPRRSASSASAGQEGPRKYDGLRRNVSVSSKQSAKTNPGSFTGIGVHRSNTVPTKMSPAAKLSKSEPAPAPAAVVTPAPVATSAESKPVETATPVTETPKPAAETATPGVAYQHSATHGPVPRSRRSVSEKQHLEGLPIDTPPPPVVTPTKERRLTSFFSKSPPPTDRQPNRLKKKRAPENTNDSARSSSASLAADPCPDVAADDGGTTPKPSHTSNPEPTQPEQSQENGLLQADNRRPHGSRTPSTYSHSSVTDQSEAEPADGRKHRRSLFHRSPKRSSEQVGLGVASPPLAAEQSTSSVGTGEKTELPDPSNQLLSLNAEVSTSSKDSSKDSHEHERKSVFGRFKAKVTRDKDRDDREKSKSPTSDARRAMSPDGGDQEKSSSDGPKDAEPVSCPVSPIPEEPITPVAQESPRVPETAAPSSPGTATAS